MANKSNKDFNTEIGELMQLARKRHKVSQDEMSAKINMSKGHISAIERGACKASVEMLLSYCTVLNMTPNEILKISSSEIEPKLVKYLLSLTPQEQENLAEILFLCRKFFKE